MATVKHWVNNNQEDNRFDVSANLPDDRTQVSFLRGISPQCGMHRSCRCYLTQPFTA